MQDEGKRDKGGCVTNKNYLKGESCELLAFHYLKCFFIARL